MSKICKVLQFVGRNGLMELLVFTGLVFFKNLRIRYQDRMCPVFLIKISLILESIAEYSSKKRLNKHIFSFPDVSNKLDILSNDQKEEIINYCDLLLANKLTPGFDYQIDTTKESFWRTDPLTGNVYSLSMDRSFFHSNQQQHEGDVRLLWEINRLQFLVTLAQGYVLSSNVAYINKIHSIIKTWKEQNPCYQSVNWLDAQDVGIRMVSLLVCRSILVSNGYKDTQLDAWDELIKQHAIFVFKNFSIARNRHNHFMTEMTSLFIFSAMTKEFKYKYLWLLLSRFLLRREIKNQVNDDGLSAEGSTNYTFFVYDAILTAHHINSELFSTELITKRMLVAIATVIEQLTINTSDFVKIGDADCGKYIRLNWCSDLSRSGYLPMINKAFLKTSKGLGESGSLECFWLVPELFQASNIQNVNKSDREKPILYSKSGYLSYVKDNRHIYLRFGPPAINHEVKFGHTHSDFLSFSLYINGNPIFIDPATYTYLGKKSERAVLRSALSHNTITLDSREFVDVHKTIFGIPELTTVIIGELVRQDGYYLIGACFEYNSSENLKRLFIFDENLECLILVNLAHSSNSKQICEHHMVAGNIKMTATGLDIFDDNYKDTPSLEWISSNDTISEIIANESHYAPRYGVIKKGNMIHRNTALKAGHQKTATVINLDKETGVTASLQNNGNNIQIKNSSRTSIIDIKQYFQTL